MKKTFFKRILAYLIDCIILFFALLIIGLFIPTFGNTNELNTRLTDLYEKYSSQEITINEFTKESQDINYDITKATYLSSIAGIVVYILYSAIYPVYNNGQTLGKKLLKIKVLKNDDKPVNINSLFIRSLIPYGILMNLVLVILILFVNKSAYMSISGVLSSIHMFVLIASIIAMAATGRGIHDYLANTKVEEI